MQSIPQFYLAENWDSAPSPSYDWILDPAWLVPDKDKIEIEAGGRGSINIHMDIPQDKYTLLQKWEVLLFVKPIGPSIFGRVLKLP